MLILEDDLYIPYPHRVDVYIGKRYKLVVCAYFVRSFIQAFTRNIHLAVYDEPMPGTCLCEYIHQGFVEAHSCFLTGKFEITPHIETLIRDYNLKRFYIRITEGDL